MDDAKKLDSTTLFLSGCIGPERAQVANDTSGQLASAITKILSPLWGRSEVDSTFALLVLWLTAQLLLECANTIIKDAGGIPEASTNG